MKKLGVFVLLLYPFMILHAQTAQQEIYANLHRSASNYYAYPTPAPDIKQSAAPKGYKPFYISTYARHGSRFLIAPSDYKAPLTVLEKADSAGKLTTIGKRVLLILDSITHLSRDRLGELTPLGARQHRGIASRMFKNYPEVFAGKAPIDARSTIVIRCILSMTAECLQLQALNPKLVFTNDASRHDIYYLSHLGKEPLDTLRNLPKAKTAKDGLDKKYVHPERLMRTLFNDTQYVAHYVNTHKLMNELFSIAGNMQSHDVSLDLYPIFTKEERYDLWQRDNLVWYIDYGPSPLTESKMPYIESNLLENILNTADTCITKKTNSATLRFGHESILLPLAALMELGNCGKVINNLDSVSLLWRNYKIFPMASNIQLVFFRKQGSDDILVKALLNEHEIQLPVHSDRTPFYHWKDLETYYREKLSRFRQSKCVQPYRARL